MKMSEFCFARTLAAFRRVSSHRYCWGVPAWSPFICRHSVWVATLACTLFCFTLEATEDMCNPGDSWVDPSTAMRFRFAPGSVGLGSPASGAQVGALWVGETEVTRRQWQRVVGNRPGHYVACGDDCPVEMIDWYEALGFANALSEKSGFPKCYDLTGCKGELGKEGPYRNTLGMVCEVAELVDNDCSGYRLPTEAEWEHFARAGTTTDFYSGDLVIESPLTACGGPALDAIAWYTCTSGQSTHPAGSKAPNPWNIFDTIGNVSEWVWDCYESTSCEWRIIKSCSATSSAMYCDVSWRGGGTPDRHLLTIVGFRLVRSATGFCRSSEEAQ